MNDGVNNFGTEQSGPGKSQPAVLFVIASVTLLAALLIPFPQNVLDVLWVFSFCFSAAAAFVCFAAKTVSDLMGFVPLLSGLSLLKLIAQAGTARRIIQEEPSGFLAERAGSAIASSWPMGSVLICLLLSVVIGIFVFSAGRSMTLTSLGYLQKVLPLKYTGIETDLRLGVIDENQARILNKRIQIEARFFSGLHQSGLLMRTEAAICIFLVVGCLLMRAAGHAHQVPGTAILNDAAGPVVGLSIFTLVPLVLVALACGSLLGRDALVLHKVDPETAASKHTKKITVVDLDADTQPETHQTGSPQNPAAVLPAHSIPEAPVLNCRNASEYYEKLSQVICSVQSRPRVLLLASEQIHSLPVTVPINIAIRLSQKGQKVLLVDADPERNALADVFDMEPEALQKKVLPSSLENLSICCVQGKKLGSFLRKTKILDHFETTMIYAPRIPAISKSDLKVRPGTFYFVDGECTDSKPTTAQNVDFCSWMCVIPSIQSVLDSA